VAGSTRKDATSAERVSTEARERLLLAALSEVAGAALVLDDRLRVVGATEEAEDAVGNPVDVGVQAPALLCGTGDVRPVAEALAEGRAVTTHIERPAREGGDRHVHVRATPIGGDPPIGWVLLLDPGEASSGPQGTVERWGLITRDPGMKRLLRDVEKVAKSDTSVLVRGETGSGKELIARAIHSASPRAEGPFRAINCAALPPTLLESELFGHVRGAFTGAVRDVKGHFELASGGTLFLDEIAELPLELQAKLLRVVQERVIVPVGGRDPVDVDVRLVTATHRSLRAEVEEGRFRADLMYRVRVIPLFLPSLRERPDDVELLAWRFVEERNAVSERRVERISPGAVRALEAYDWPGNVRELVNAVEYAFVMGEGPVLTEAELPPEVRGEEAGAPEPLAGAPSTAVRANLPPEARRILTAIERAGGHHGRAAASLGISRTTLWRRLKKYGLDEG